MTSDPSVLLDSFTNNGSDTHLSLLTGVIETSLKRGSLLKHKEHEVKRNVIKELDKPPPMNLNKNADYRKIHKKLPKT